MSSSGDDGVRSWDLRKLQLLNHFETNSQVNAIRYDSTGCYLAICSMGLKVFQNKMGHDASIDFHGLKDEDVKTICFGRDNSFIAVGSNHHNLKIFYPSAET